MANWDNRSAISKLFGDFLERRGNVTALIVLLSVGTICYLAVFKDYKEFPEVLKAIALASVGFYLGTRVKEDK